MEIKNISNKKTTTKNKKKNKKPNRNKVELQAEQDKIIKLQRYDLSHFIGRS